MRAHKRVKRKHGLGVAVTRTMLQKSINGTLESVSIFIILQLSSTVLLPAGSLYGVYKRTVTPLTKDMKQIWKRKMSKYYVPSHQNPLMEEDGTAHRLRGVILG